MKLPSTYHFVLILGIMALSSCSPRFFNETQQGNMYLRNSKVYFQKTYNHPVSFQSAIEGLRSFNTPNGGFQANLEDENKLNGVMVNFNFDWLIDGNKKIKVPTLFKNPLNASFEIEKKAGSYTVRVTNIWIAGPQASKQKNITIESLFVSKNGCCFLKSKSKLKILDLIDRNFSKIFSSPAAGGELRF